MVQNLHQLNQQMIVNIQNRFNKLVVFMAVATTFTVTSSPTGLLSTKTTSSEPLLSVTARVIPDPSSDSKETTAIGNEMISTEVLASYLWYGMDTVIAS